MPSNALLQPLSLWPRTHFIHTSCEHLARTTSLMQASRKRGRPFSPLFQKSIISCISKIWYSSEKGKCSCVSVTWTAPVTPPPWCTST